jgi:hypothetical protein
MSDDSPTFDVITVIASIALIQGAGDPFLIIDQHLPS